MSAVAERDSDKDGWLPAACDLSLAPRPASLEVALFDIASEAATPHRLTQLIEAGFAAPSGQPANWAARMSVIDRQIALFRLALSLGAWPAWFVARCECCGKPIDIRAAADEFTITPGPPLPAAIWLETGGTSARFAIPAARHEDALQRSDATLAAICLEQPQIDPAPFATAFEHQLAALLPGLKTELRFPCALCRAETGFWFDPWSWISRHCGQCLAEVDMLARAYGWAEAAILSMPERRRNIYLSMLGAQP